MKPKNKSANIPFLADVQELSNFKGRKAIVGSLLTFVSSGSDEKLVQDMGLVALPPRDAGASFLKNLRKSAPKLKMYARKEVFTYNKTRFAFLPDAYLSYGLREQAKDELLAVIGGIERPHERFPITILIFDKNGLLRTQEQTLAPMSSDSFTGDCNGVVQALKQEHGSIRIVVAAPLSPWVVPGVEHEARIPFQKMSFKPLTAAKAAQERYGLPAATVALGALLFGVQVADGWSELSAARERFRVANSDPAVKKQGGVDNNYLNVMTLRRQYMEAPRRQDLLSSKTMEIIRGIGAVPNVTIVEIRMPAPSISTPVNQVGINPAARAANDAINRQPDVWMKVSVPKSNGPGLYQARDVIHSLINSTGMTIQTAPEGWTEENGRRIFVLEGTINV